MSEVLGAALTTAGYAVRQVVSGVGWMESSEPTLRHGDRWTVDFSSPDALRHFHARVGDAVGRPLGCVINFLGLTPPKGTEGAQAAALVARQSFNVVKEFEEALKSAAAEGGGWFINLTGLGGKFGVEGCAAGALAGAGTLGIAKTLQREARLPVKNIDLDPTMEPGAMAARLLQELTAADDLLEVGLNRQGRWRLRLDPHMPASQAIGIPLEAGAVVLVTGGAYGITADAALSLAAGKPRLVLVGRSPLPGEESAETRGLEGPALRERLLALARSGGSRVTPAIVEQSLKAVLKDRQIRATLAACRSAGATAEYHALDVRDAVQFGGLIEDLYRRLGRIDGVIHGAGIIDDKRIRDKTPEGFERVFGTKVDGAWTLAQKLRPERLKFFVLFSSVSGRFGNTGQADYSAANEYLNKLASHLGRRWPGRVVAINWGPWDAGMMSDGLRRIYAAAGLELIPVAEGIRLFQAELQYQCRQSPEVMISCSVERMARANPDYSPQRTQRHAEN